MAAISVEGVSKGFTLHLQNGATIPVFSQVELCVEPGECVALTGASGVGKSTLLKLIYGNYRALGGTIRIMHQGRLVDLVSATPRQILSVRRHSLGYVSQFLRCVPRVAALDVVAQPLVDQGHARKAAQERARAMLLRLNLPEKILSLPPATFSGGEQQRINIARGFVCCYPIMLLDEPTASLDRHNRQRVINLIHEARQRGAAIIGIFHDRAVRREVATRKIDIEQMRLAA